MILEICAGSIDSALAAARGGAARIELCQGLADGGVTPSAGLIRAAVAVEGLKVNVLIRPREGDFLYTPHEVEIMEADVRLCRECGCNGVVIGALRSDGTVDTDTCRRLIEAAGPEMEVTFHRAFDLCASPFDALDVLVGLGCRRVLTSGQAASAMEGAAMLRRLVDYAAGRIIILAGGGVNSANVGELVRLSGVDEVHGSARAIVPSAMEFRREGVSMGVPGADEYARKATDWREVKRIVEAVGSI